MNRKPGKTGPPQESESQPELWQLVLWLEGVSVTICRMNTVIMSAENETINTERNLELNSDERELQ